MVISPQWREVQEAFKKTRHHQFSGPCSKCLFSELLLWQVQGFWTLLLCLSDLPTALSNSFLPESFYSIVCLAVSHSNSNLLRFGFEVPSIDTSGYKKWSSKIHYSYYFIYFYHYCIFFIIWAASFGFYNRSYKALFQRDIREAWQKLFRRWFVCEAHHFGLSATVRFLVCSSHFVFFCSQCFFASVDLWASCAAAFRCRTAILQSASPGLLLLLVFVLLSIRWDAMWGLQLQGKMAKTALRINGFKTEEKLREKLPIMWASFKWSMLSLVKLIQLNESWNRRMYEQHCLSAQEKSY